MVDFKDILKELRDRGYLFIENLQSGFSVFRIKDDETLILVKVNVSGFSHKNNDNSIISTGLTTLVIPSKKIINTAKIEPNEDLEVEEIIRGSNIIRNGLLHLQLTPIITQVKRTGQRSKNGSPLYQVTPGLKQINLGLNSNSELPKPGSDTPGIQ